MNETIESFKINKALLERVLKIKENDQRSIKRGFKTWLKYIRTWKKLKVGDRVRIINTDFESYELQIGKTGVIKSIGIEYTQILLDKEIVGSEGVEWLFAHSYLEKITEIETSTTESQNKQILKYLLTGATINPITALELFGSFRLSARIHDLKGQGHNIKTTMVYNGRKKWANYNLVQ